MDIEKLQRRDSTLDVVRIFAFFSVVSVHFFLRAGFYGVAYDGFGPVESIVKAISEHNPENLSGLWMFIAFMGRTYFSVCVPLFIMLTGYLMSKKTLSRKYYSGIRKTLIIFVLASVAHFFFKAFHDDELVKAALGSGIENVFNAFVESETLDIKHLIFGTLDFSLANYSWYIEMYIGLFLIIPFLNLGYNKLKTQRQKQVLLATLIFMTILPSLFNIFNFDTVQWWLDPRSSDEYQKLLPAFWKGFYPVTYYYIGMYIREYGVRPKTKSLFGILGVSLLLGTCFNIYRSHGGGFISGVYNTWYGFIPCILAVITFALLLRIKSDNWNIKVKYGLWKLSDLVIGAYLMSKVSDTIIYEILKNNVSPFIARIPYYFITVPLSMIMAFGFSFILNYIYIGIMKLYEMIKALVKSQRNKNTGYLWQDVLFIILFMVVAVITLRKCIYGFGGNDEAFYLTIPHRLVQGDALFVDEWHLSQLSGFLLMPFVWLYSTVFQGGGTEGIILAARILYIVVHSLAVIFLYTRLRKYGYITVVGIILYYLYTPYDIMALSYDSMGLELVILTGVMLATADYDKKLMIILSGLAFAGAVLCNPYLAVAYVLYFICVIIHMALRKKELNFVLKSRMFSLRTFLFFTLGAGILAVVFLVFLLTRCSVSDVFKNLPYMLEDPAHKNVSLLSKFGKYFKTVYENTDLFKYFVYGYGATLIAMLIDRKRKNHRSIYLLISIFLAIFTLITYLPDLVSKRYNSIMFPMIFITITAYILCDKKPRELFASLFCLGFLYSVFIFTTSNQGFYIIPMALTASNLAGFVFLSQLVREMREKPDNIAYALWMKRMSFVMIAVFLCFQGALQMHVKAHHVFWDKDPKELTYMIEDGPAKGIYTTKGNYDNYYETYNDLQEYYYMDPGNILFLTKKAYTYLSVKNYRYGTYSGWLGDENEVTLRHLNDYYTVNPDKIPKYIYLPKDTDFDVDSVIKEARDKGYSVKETDYGYRMQKK